MAEKPQKKITFEQYVARRPQIKPQHIAGMKAFVLAPNKARTESDWDSLFKHY